MNTRQRQFLFVAVAVAATGPWAAMRAPAADAAPSLVFLKAGNEYRFDTGTLRGTLRPRGQSQGLGDVRDVTSGKTISRIFGLLSPYRLLAADARFGAAVWDWASQARLLDNGAVEVRWQADREHPLNMTAVYRLAAADAVDLTLTVTPQRELPGFELYVASYFEGFPRSFAYVRGGALAQNAPQPSFVETRQVDGRYQVFPRDDVATRLLSDGRWKHPPDPVQWSVRQPMAAPLAIRRDAGTGLAAAVMALPADCFAVAMPYGEEPHRSLYLSLFGRDLKTGNAAVARVRLVIRRGLSDEKAAQLHHAFEREKSLVGEIGIGG